MKRCLRFCLIFLISLALPLSGMAGLAAATEPCPMEAAGVAMMTPETSGDVGQDCCQDMGSPSDHGKPCKPGQECKTASLLQVSIVKPPVTLSSPVVLSFSSDFLPAQAPSGVWRPPRV
ncbi:hypothetical protein D3880_12165 [Pseudomonas cavernae]|uniref:Uncharacterized protein n=1 Tax=Pseudomonas cavernae TaxID=2320867 RepID=A0A385Z6E5_9PSED|nr:hypothetical protein [Pseudomonas cavernae]AYC33072.1 hypothetical protein D3880_12165 [Pseudomonas cavernae]